MNQRDRDRHRSKPAVVHERRMTAEQVDIQRRARERVMVRLAIAALLFIVTLLLAMWLSHRGH
jgi:hypothetical protein